MDIKDIEMKFPPTSFWTFILAMVALLTGVVAVTQHIITQSQDVAEQAQKLEIKQLELQQWLDGSTRQLEEITKTLEEISGRVSKNTEMLSTPVMPTEYSIKLENRVGALEISVGGLASDLNHIGNEVTLIACTDPDFATANWFDCNHPRP